MPMHRSARLFRTRIALPALALGLLSACADQTTAPTRMVAPSSRSSDVIAAPVSGTYLVLARGNSFSKEFSKRVAALGGKVRSMHDGTGFAVVTGITADGASQLAAVSGVSEVDADGVVSLAKPVANVRADASVVASHHMQNDIDPTAAALFSWQWN